MFTMKDEERANYTVGKHGWSKLTEDDVREILYARGDTHNEVAERHGVTRLTILRIRNGQTWKDVYAEVQEALSLL